MEKWIVLRSTVIECRIIVAYNVTSDSFIKSDIRRRNLRWHFVVSVIQFAKRPGRFLLYTYK